MSMEIVTVLIAVTLGCAPNVPLTSIAPDIGTLRSPAADSQRAAVTAAASATGESLAFLLCDPSDVDTAGLTRPVPRNQLQLKYPRAAMRREFQGWVALQFIIGADGLVDPHSIVVIRASHVEFIETAQVAIREERFFAARRQGVRVRTLARQLVQFKIGPPPSR